MSRANIERSLEAVEQALGHFAESLDRAGFAAGTDAYREMAQVVVGQWIWVDVNGADDLEPRFRRIAHLAKSVSGQLLPYVTAMQKLSSLSGLVAERWGVEPGSTADKIIGTLIEVRQPVSAVELQSATGASSAKVRRELSELLDRNVVVRIGQERPRYAIQSETPTTRAARK